MRYDLVDLKLFRAIAETSSLSAGAAQIYLSAGSASYRLKNLELLIGTALFVRSPRGMVLTPAGERLHRHVMTVFSDLERMHGEMSEFGKGIRGSIRLYANSSSLNGFLSEDLSSFLSANPQCNIDLQEHNSDEIVLAVSDGTADLGIVASDVESGDLQVFPYATDNLVLAVSHEHPLASQGRIKLEDALDYDFVCMQRTSSNFHFLTQTCGKMGKQLNIRIHAHNFSTVLRLARDNIGAALVPRRVLESNLAKGSCAIVELTDEWALRRLKVITHETEKTSQFARNLVKHLLLRSEPRQSDSKLPL